MNDEEQEYLNALLAEVREVGEDEILAEEMYLLCLDEGHQPIYAYEMALEDMGLL